MKRTAWIALLPLVLLLATALPHLDQGDFRTDTARYAAVGLQGWRDLSLFWTPHLHPDNPYLNKPPLVFWIHGLALYALGVSLVVARLPTLLAAAGCVALTSAIARRLAGRSVALIAGCVLALTYEFVRRTREISLDMWQLCFMLACVALAVRAAQRRMPAGFWLAGVPLGLALLCKPLMALLVVPILCLWLDRPQRRAMLARTLPMALILALPWHLSMWHIHGSAFPAQYFAREIVDRTLGHLNRQPPWYYLAEMGRSYWPWMLPAALGVWHYVRRRSPRDRRRLSLAMIWLAAWGVALTCFPDKRPRYALPFYPALAMVCAMALVRVPWMRLRRWSRPGPLAATALAGAALGLLIALLPLRVQAPPDPHQRAFAAWASRLYPEPVYAAALSSNDEGLFYLLTGRWPEPIWTHAGTRCHAPPTGARLAYVEGLSPSPGANEDVVFRAGPITVTRLAGAVWQPR